LAVAIRRLTYAYERDKVEDKLVDLMVAFEVLFFKEGQVGEFRHELSVRVARFLASEYGPRKKITKDVNDLCEKRSSVMARTLL